MASAQFPKPLRGLIFDLDGTLVDTEPLHFESQNRVLVELGSREMPKAEFERYVGWAEEAFWAEVARDYRLSLPPRELARLRSRALLELYRTVRVPVLPGVPELLSRLGELGLPCAVASSSPRDQIEATLEQAGLSPHFQVLRSGHDDVEQGKPHPAVYLAAAAALGVEASGCIAVEDSSTGLASATAAGCFTVAIPCTSHPETRLGQARLVLSSAAELLALIG